MSSNDAELRRIDCSIPREFVVASLTFFFVPVCFYLDVGSTLVFQNTLGVGAWLCLFVLLAGEDKAVRLQVCVAVVFATVGEHFASIYMEGYVYRFQNVPAFVPPGHGLVYLTAVVLARSDPFVRFQRSVTSIVFLIGSCWSLWGLLYGQRSDVVGFVLFLIYLFCVLKGPSPRVYLGAFFITSWLELVGTFLGTWSWMPMDPASGLPQGNPPSGVSAWYCLVDAVAIGGAPCVARWLDSLQAKARVALRPEGNPVSGLRSALYWCINHAKLPVFALIIFL